MNAVLFYVTPTFRLTGSTLNALEYFLAIHEHNKKIKLILINGTPMFKNFLLRITKERYNLGLFNRIKNNIILMRRSNLVTIKFDQVLVIDYMTIKETKGILSANKIIVISEKYTADPIYFYDKNLYNVEYYGEMFFHYKDHEYKMKCLFNRYKPLKNVSEGTYVNSPRNPNFIYEMNTDDFKKIYDCPGPYIFKNKTNPEENLFEKFTHYVYYHANKWFDPHPRLFLECTFYDKKIVYINSLKIKDGSWYRYIDIKENGLKNRTLSKEDEIVCQLI